MKTCCTFPGKIGDLLWALPTVKVVAADGEVDLITSEYCRPLERLLKAQPYINDVVIPEDYVIEWDGCGIQPWMMPADGYDEVIHLGFRMLPHLPLKEYVAYQAGVVLDDSFSITFPTFRPPEPYIVMIMAERPLIKRDLHGLLLEIAEEVIDHAVVWLGAREEELPGINLTGLDFLESAGILAAADALISLPTSCAVLSHLLGKRDQFLLVFGAEALPIFRIAGSLPIRCDHLSNSEIANRVASLVDLLKLPPSLDSRLWTEAMNRFNESY